jgi:hypothetical protein
MKLARTDAAARTCSSELRPRLMPSRCILAIKVASGPAGRPHHSDRRPRPLSAGESRGNATLHPSSRARTLSGVAMIHTRHLARRHPFPREVAKLRRPRSDHDVFYEERRIGRDWLVEAGAGWRSKRHADASGGAGINVAGMTAGAGYDFACLLRRLGIGGQMPISG